MRWLSATRTTRSRPRGNSWIHSLPARRWRTSSYTACSRSRLRSSFTAVGGGRACRFERAPPPGHLAGHLRWPGRDRDRSRCPRAAREARGRSVERLRPRGRALPAAGRGGHRSRAGAGALRRLPWRQVHLGRVHRSGRVDDTERAPHFNMRLTTVWGATVGVYSILAKEGAQILGSEFDLAILCEAAQVPHEVYSNKIERALLGRAKRRQSDGYLRRTGRAILLTTPKQ